MSCKRNKPQKGQDADGNSGVPEQPAMSRQEQDARRMRLLQKTLSVSVPAVMEKIQSGEIDVSPETMIGLSDFLGEKGEAFLYPMEETPHAYASVVQIIAFLAIKAPGGVNAFGLHFEQGLPVMTEEDYLNQAVA